MSDEPRQTPDENERYLTRSEAEKMAMVICAGCGAVAAPSEAMDANWRWALDTDNNAGRLRRVPICPACMEIARFRP